MPLFGTKKKKQRLSNSNHNFPCTYFRRCCTIVDVLQQIMLVGLPISNKAKPAESFMIRSDAVRTNGFLSDLFEDFDVDFDIPDHGKGAYSTG